MSQYGLGNFGLGIAGIGLAFSFLVTLAYLINLADCIGALGGILLAPLTAIAGPFYLGVREGRWAIAAISYGLCGLGGFLFLALKGKKMTKDAWEWLGILSVLIGVPVLILTIAFLFSKTGEWPHEYGYNQVLKWVEEQATPTRAKPAKTRRPSYW